MKNLLLGLCAFLIIVTSVQAEQINLTVQLDGEIFNGASLDVITDGHFPVEGMWDGGDTNPAPDRWNGSNNAAFRKTDSTVQDIFYFDFGGMYELLDVKLAVDNNDKYTIQYLTETNAWQNLFIIQPGYSSVTLSMDNFTTVAGEDILGDSRVDYYSAIDFSPVTTNKLRLFAYDSVDTNYSIGEFQAFGTAIEIEDDGNSPVPEPATMVLFGLGILGVVGVSRRREQLN